jgi:hypothetical protein
VKYVLRKCPRKRPNNIINRDVASAQDHIKVIDRSATYILRVIAETIESWISKSARIKTIFGKLKKLIFYWIIFFVLVIKNNHSFIHHNRKDIWALLTQKISVYMCSRKKYSKDYFDKILKWVLFEIHDSIDLNTSEIINYWFPIFITIYIFLMRHSKLQNFIKTVFMVNRNW